MIAKRFLTPLLGISAALFAATSIAAPTTTATAPATTTVARLTLDQVVQAEVTSVLDDLERGGSTRQATARLNVLFDQVAAFGTDKTLDAFRDAAFARRLVRQLASLPADQRLDLLKYLRAHDTLARSMAFMIHGSTPEAEAAPYLVLNALRVKHADELEKFATLATAICVVHDRPFTRRINENKTSAPTAEDLFTYYTANEKNMLFGLRNVPAELLIYVVDTTASIDDMKWALKQYAGDQAVGHLFFVIAYDHDYFKTGTDKKVDQHGYNLPNILKYGGVCADQAFFATEIGKSIGVPTAYTTGESATVGHAWVGFLQARGDKGAWNFDEGRYAEYRGVRGNVIDPQTRNYIPDSYVSLLAELIGTKPADRQAAVALTDAAARLGALTPAEFTPASFPQKIADARATARPAGVDPALELLETAIAQNKGYSRPWGIIWELAKSNQLNLAQKKKWSDAILRLCGAKYPDFAMAVLEPLIASVEDPVQQSQYWDVAFASFQNRADIAASIRMNQAQLWENQHQSAKAGKCYEDVINRYANAGPFVLDAIAGAEKLLEGKTDKILLLYEQTWNKLQKPHDMAGPFMRQSNWYQLGSEYAAKLRDAGQTQKALTVSNQLGDAAP